MNNLTQFWPQFSVVLIFLLFLTKDLLGLWKDNIRISASVELVRYIAEFAIVISTGFLSWSILKVFYVLDVSITILLVAVLLIFWRQFTVVAMSSDKMKDTFASKVRLWDFASILLLFFAGFFDDLIAALWK